VARDAAAQRLGRQDELTHEILEALDLLGVALAQPLEIGLEPFDGCSRPEPARAPPRVGGREAPQRPARQLATAPPAPPGPALLIFVLI
jgi:hypothetical protein